MADTSLIFRNMLLFILLTMKEKARKPSHLKSHKNYKILNKLKQ